MIKTVVWLPGAKRNIQRIKQFHNDRNKSSAYSKKLLQVFKDAAGVIENQPPCVVKCFHLIIIKDCIFSPCRIMPVNYGIKKQKPVQR